MSVNLIHQCRDRIVVFDGAMGTQIQKLNLSSDDYWGKTGCNEILNLSRPQAIREIHADYLEVGCDVIETNTFGANSVVLADYDLSDQTYQINLAAAKLAREIVRDFSTRNQPRFVAGSIGPSTKLPSLAQISFHDIQRCYLPQIEGLIDGGVDALIVETSQDLLHLKAVLISIAATFRKRRIKLPLIAQVTMEKTGKMLVGSDMLTVIVALSPFDIDALGLNCSTGPDSMTGHLRTLSRHWDRLISVMPNAGMPRVENGNIYYDLQPELFADQLKNFVAEIGVNIVGGCCGATPEHLKAVVHSVKDVAPLRRKPEIIKAATSLYNTVSFGIEPGPLIVGERCNANGSKIFRQHLLAEDFDGMLSVARQQEDEGAHFLDVATAHVDADELRTMAKFVSLLNTNSSLPLMIDSTKAEVIEAALQNYGGKGVINSVNLENEESLSAILSLCQKFGAAVVALTIDQQGMAKSAEQKISIARKLIDIIHGTYSIPYHDIFIDALTFTLGSGDRETRSAAIETLAAIRALKQEFPQLNTILGISNISYGLKPVIRHRLNSVFLAHAIEAGLTAAILHAGKIIPLYRIPPAERTLLENLIFNRWENSVDPLMAILNYYKDYQDSGQPADDQKNLPAEQRLKNKIINGTRAGLDRDIAACLQTHDAIEIINTILMDGMKRVGELFSRGQMQLPFVLQSAEVMRAALVHLQPCLEKTDIPSRGKIVLATVKGDVHDIGKNLVDIILSNNGFEVVNLGIKQTIESMTAALREHNADALGMSGLLVNSTLVMKENLKFLNEQNIHIPVLVGGAALTQSYVENELRKIYQGAVYYAKDAFDGLQIMERIERGEQPDYKTKYQVGQPSVKKPFTDASDLIQPVQPPKPPFWGRKAVN
ncbi:MAG: homocysteine S-methyltransferase family protein, partial [bacterium]|nr:homocysteine S-methyltransferase family protein [bacterium]